MKHVSRAARNSWILGSRPDAEADRRSVSALHRSQLNSSTPQPRPAALVKSCRSPGVAAGAAERRG
eukprot:5973572-Prymnesium_polylepis.2